MAGVSAGLAKNGHDVGMYSLKPYYDVDEQIVAPDCMYKLNSIYSSQFVVGSYNGQASRDALPGSDISLEALEQRQKDILARLSALQKQVADLVAKQDSATLVANKPSTEVKQPLQRVSSPVKTINDIVVTANPQSPPLSVFVLARMLADQSHVLLSTFVHSSARSLVGPQHINVFKNDGDMVTDRNSYSLGITVIWKDEQCGPTLIVKPGQQVPIRGEANITRFLGRLLVNRYDSQNIIATQIDTALDKAAELLLSDKVQSLNIASSVSALLGGNGKSKSGWICGFEQHSLADVVLWSVVNQRCTGNLPDDVRQWVCRCDQLPEFCFAASVLK